MPQPLVDQYEVLFLQNLMLRDGGLLTLLGSKPITTFDVTSRLAKTEEEFAENYRDLKEFLELAKQKPGHPNANTPLLSYEEYREKSIRERETCQFCDRKKIWEEWMAKIGPISTPMYKILTRGTGDRRIGLFINIAQLQYILKKYQNEFSQIVQMNFDPERIIDSIGDENSLFWEKVFKNHYLLGLIFGYGEKNSYLFDWANRQPLVRKFIEIDRFPELSRSKQYARGCFKTNVSIEDLTIPNFISFEIEDLEMKRYSKEKEKIVAFLKEKDLITFVLKCLQP